MNTVHAATPAATRARAKKINRAQVADAVEAKLAAGKQQPMAAAPPARLAKRAAKVAKPAAAAPAPTKPAAASPKAGKPAPATKPAPAPAPTPTARAAKGKRAPDDRRITMIPESNPHAPASKAYAKFEKLQRAALPGRTIDQVAALTGDRVYLVSMVNRRAIKVS